MYKIEFVKETLELLKKYDYQLTKVAKLRGIKLRTLASWRDKEKKGLPIFKEIRESHYKWSKEDRDRVIDYYFEHGENCSKAIRTLGYPGRTTLMNWVKKDPRFKKEIIAHKTPVTYNAKEKQKIVIDFNTRDSSVETVALKYNTTRTSLYKWSKNILGTISMKEKDLTKKELKDEIKRLKKQREELLLENEILKKASEILKKEVGVDYSLLNNKEKASIVNALKEKYKVSKLIKILNIKKSSYYYENKMLGYDKFEPLRNILKKAFINNYSCYGYRRLKTILAKEKGIKLSEKVVRRLMKEEKLFVYQPHKRKYSSYKGEISQEVENIIKRNFHSNEPHMKLLTDITEFGLKDGKVYLSPLIDCFTGSPICWTIGTSPSSNLTNQMLIDGKRIIGDKKATIHSDRGFHYRTPSWIGLMDEYGFIRSMSKKGCSPDNSAGEGFFGTLKNEFFYSRDWKQTTCSEFIPKLNGYLKWFVSKRIKLRLNYDSPNNFMLNYK